MTYDFDNMDTLHDFRERDLNRTLVISTKELGKLFPVIIAEPNPDWKTYKIEKRIFPHWARA